MQQMENITQEIPVLTVPESETDSHWKFIPNVAQYKGADWSNCVGIAHRLTVEQAKVLADSNPEITFFFYVKGYSMVLENTEVSPAIARIFHHGDAVFFSGNPNQAIWWGSAVDLADGYVKQ